MDSSETNFAYTIKFADTKQIDAWGWRFHNNSSRHSTTSYTWA